jgi:hypothetical protein
MDTHLLNFFAATRDDPTSSLAVQLGSLLEFTSLFPILFDSNATSLLALGQLVPASSRIRSNDARPAVDPSLQVTLCLGLGQSSDDLYPFFHSMLEFQGKDAFAALLINGFSLVVTGGALNEIAAAAIFVVTRDGVFIDAIAVSHGRAPNMCKLSRSTHVGPDNGQRSLIISLTMGVSSIVDWVVFYSPWSSIVPLLFAHTQKLRFFWRAIHQGSNSTKTEGLLASQVALLSRVSFWRSANFTTIESEGTSLFSKPVEVLRLRGNGPSNPHKKQTAYKTTGDKKAKLKRKLGSARPPRKGKPTADSDPSSSSISSESHEDEEKKEDEEKEKELPDTADPLLDSNKPAVGPCCSKMVA